MSKYKFDMSINISPETIKSMITDMIEQEVNRKVSRVELNLSKVSVGYGRDERDEAMFTGATIYFQGEHDA